jgi:hypothetical protein
MDKKVLIGVGLLAAVGIGAVVMMSGGEEDELTDTDTTSDTTPDTTTDTNGDDTDTPTDDDEEEPPTVGDTYTPPTPDTDSPCAGSDGTIPSVPSAYKRDESSALTHMGKKKTNSNTNTGEDCCINGWEIYKVATDRGVYYPGDTVKLSLCLSISDKDYAGTNEYVWAGPDTFDNGYQNWTGNTRNKAPFEVTMTFENNDGTIIKESTTATKKSGHGKCSSKKVEVNYGFDGATNRDVRKWSEFEWVFSIPNNADSIGKWQGQLQFTTSDYESEGAFACNCGADNRPDDWTGNMDTAFYVVASSDCLGAEEVKQAEGDVVSTMSNIDFLNSYMAF